MPRIDRTWKQLWDEDIAVFRTLAPKLRMMMVAHAAYPLTRDKEPASISRFWISTVLT